MMKLYGRSICSITFNSEIAGTMIIPSKYSIDIPPVDVCSYVFGMFERLRVKLFYQSTKAQFLINRLIYAKHRSIRVHKCRLSNTENHEVRIENTSEETRAGSQKNRRLA